MRKAYGFIRESLEIKILILFVMRRLPKAATLEELIELVLFDEAIGYFDFMDCLADLVRTEHIVFREDKYAITPKGDRNGLITEKSLPPSVRDYVEDSTFAHRNIQDRADKIFTIHKKNKDNSCTVTLSLSDGIGDIITIDLYAATEEHAIRMEKSFQKNAENIYNEFVKMVLD